MYKHCFYTSFAYIALSLGSSLCAMQNGIHSDPNYQQNNIINGNPSSNAITNSAAVTSQFTLPETNLNPADLTTNNRVLDLSELMPKNEKELSNKQLLEKAGFTFSGLPKTTKKSFCIAPVNESNSNSDIKIPIEMIPLALQLMNNNADAQAQKTQEIMDSVLTEISKSKNPIIQQSNSWIKGIFSTIGLGGTSASGSLFAGGCVFVGYLILTKTGWFK